MLNCICCSNKIINPLFKVNHYNLHTCSNCGFKFVNPLPTIEEIEIFYNKTRVVENLSETIKNSIISFDTIKNNPKKDWFDLVLNKSKNILKKEKLSILELGSGYGFFIHYCNNQGHKAIGTEVTKDYALATSASINGSIHYISSNDYDSVICNSEADLIYLEHVFEHVLDPQTILSKITTKLSPNGILFMSVPNSDSLLARVLKKKWPWMTPPDHLYYYNDKSLRMLLESNNYEIIETFSNDYYFRSINQLYSLAPLYNFVIKKINQIFKAKMNSIPFDYRYPNNLKTILLTLPYWLMLPILKIFPNSGNELSIIAKKRN